MYGAKVFPSLGHERSVWEKLSPIIIVLKDELNVYKLKNKGILWTQKKRGKPRVRCDLAQVTPWHSSFLKNKLEIIKGLSEFWIKYYMWVKNLLPTTKYIK